MQAILPLLLKKKSQWKSTFKWRQVGSVQAGKGMNHYRIRHHTRRRKRRLIVVWCVFVFGMESLTASKRHLSNHDLGHDLEQKNKRRRKLNRMTDVFVHADLLMGQQTRIRE